MLARILALILLATPAGAATVVSLSFDDTYQEHVLARQILDARGLKGTFYVNSPRIGGANPLYMSRAEVDALAAAGHEIGGHTLGHLDLTQQTTAEVQLQVCQDRQNLLAMGYSPTTFAYPFGAHDASVRAVVSGCGYSSARTVGGLGCTGCPDAEPLPPPDALAARTPGSVRAGTTLAQMQQSVIDAEQSGGGWVPFVFHRICTGCSEFSVSSANLAAFADWLQARGAQGTVVRTVGQALGQPPPLVQPVGVCQTSSGAWRNEPFSPMNGPFTAEWDAVAHAAGSDFVMGLSSGPAASFIQLAAIARFYTNGFIQARNGSVYTSVGPIPYTPGLFYHFRMDVDPAGHDYTAYVSSPGGPPLLLASSYTFRTEQSATSVIDNLGFIADVGSGTLCDLAVSSSMPAPDVSSPAVALTAPAAGAVLRGTVTVSAAASDDVAVAAVQFRLDGVPLGPPDASVPYSALWDTVLSTDGPHSLDAVAWDTSGNVSTSAAVAVTVDNTPPSISSVAAFVHGPSSASVTWLTGEPASSQVEYGTSAAYGSLTALDASTVTSHARLLIGLSSGTVYHYRVRSADPAGNLAVSGDFTFSTPAVLDVSSPTVALSSPAAGSILRGTVTVTAAASDDVAVASVQFRLDGAPLGPPDTVPPYAFVWNTASSADGPHSLVAVAWDTSGNVSTSAAVAATVDNTPPSISSVAAFVHGPSSASVTWLTGEPASARVEYGLTTAYGSLTAPDSSTVTSHARLLAGLSPGATYHYRVRSADAAGNLAVSGDFSFVTAPQPPSACIVSSGAWRNLAFSAQSGPFTAEWDAVPHTPGGDVVMGLSSGATAAFTQLAAITRFYSNGLVQARSGSVYTAVSSIPYTAGVSYHFRFAVLPASHTYSAFVSSPGGPPRTVASNYAFRTEQAALGVFNDLGFIADVGSGTLCNLSVAPDLTPPAVALSAPAGGSVVAGNVAVTASASDDIAVSRVQFKIDGAPLGAPDASPPYSIVWNTALSSEGPHSLTAVAWDAANNASTSAPVSVIVDNQALVISSVAASGVAQSSAVVSWRTSEPATSQVEYGTSAAYGSATAPDPSTVAAHAQVLSGLSAGTLYHYRVKSTDTAGDFAASGDFTFVTAAPPDVSSPTVSLSSPPAGAVLRGTVTVVAAAADDTAVAAVQFRLDGADLGPPDAVAPYAFLWDTALSTDGPHSLSAVAWDAAGNASTAAAVAVMVDNTPPVISSVALADVGSSSAVVSWLTDEGATSQVEYGTTTAYGSITALDPSTVTSHARLLSGLASATLYHYRVRSADVAGNLAVSGDSVFSTLVVPDTTAPNVAVSSPPAGAVLRGTVTVTASAFDDVAVATVQFRLDGADLGPPGFSAPFAFVWDTALSTDGAHSLDAVAWDGSGNASTAAAVAVMVDNTPPVISSVALADVGSSSAVVSWLTDEGATSQVEYGTTTAYGSFTALDPSTVTGHARGLSGLSPGTTYHYRVRSADVAGNVAVSGDFDFATLVVPDTAPPNVAISSPLDGAVLRGTVTVTAAASDGVAVATVQLRLDGADLGPPDSSAPYAFLWDTALSTDGPHSLSAVAWDAAGNASTAAAVSVTVDNTPPIISSVSLSDVGLSSAAVAWLTDEPADSRVEYGTSASYGSFTALDPSTVTSHARVLAGLSPGTTYHYRALSADVAGNLAVSGDFTFTTSSPPAVSCLSSAGAWVNQPFAPQLSSFTVTFDVTPGAANMNGSIGLSSGTAGELGGLAAELRFNPQGFIDVRHSSAYAAMTPVPYGAGVPYRFDLRVHAAAHLYDVDVSTPGGARRRLARNYTFRSSQGAVTSLSNLGLVAASGGLSACNATVSASTVPWWDGVRELYATAAGSKTWYSSWDNGIARSFGRAVDPVDPWFDAAHGTAQYSVDAASGVFRISGSTPRMYIHHPEFHQGSTSSTVAGSRAKQWHDVEVTVYGMRVADSNIAWGGIDGIARSNHGITGNETVHLCDSRGIGARFRYNGRLDFEKETRHPTSFAVNTTTTSLWPSGTSMPFNVWIGFKFVVYDLPSGDVKVESYMDMTDGAGGGDWVLVNQFEDTGSNWGGGSGCAPGVNPQERLTNASDRPGTETGLPNVSVYFRSDGVGTNGLLYKKMSIREIAAPAGGGPPLLAAAAAPGAGDGGIGPSQDPAAFEFRDAYAFPNPSRRGQPVTIRLQAGLADSVDVSVYDVTGRRVARGSAAGPALLDDGNGKGPQLTYDYRWDVGGAPSGVYFYSVQARKQGRGDIGKTGKAAVIK